MLRKLKWYKQAPYKGETGLGFESPTQHQQKVLILIKGVDILILDFLYFLVKMTVLIFAMKFLSDVLKTFITEKYKRKKEVDIKPEPELDDRFRFKR